MSKRTVLVTLTYRPNEDGSEPAGAKELIREDAEKFRKTITKRYGKTQYVIAGEYGEKRQRAHWHALLFFKEGQKLPPWADLPERARDDYWWISRGFGPVSDDGQRHPATFGPDGSFWSCGVQCYPVSGYAGADRTFRAIVPEWHHGHVDIRIPDHGGFGYVAKYLLKSGHAEKLDVRAGMTKQRASIISRGLGIAYVKDMGERAADKGLEPTDGLYTVPGSTFRRGRRAGAHVRFPMTRAMRRDYLNAFMRRMAFRLALGEVQTFVVKGDYLMAHLDRDAAMDPRNSAIEFAKHLRHSVDMAKAKRDQLNEADASSSAVDASDAEWFRKFFRGGGPKSQVVGDEWLKFTVSGADLVDRCRSLFKQETVVVPVKGKALWKKPPVRKYSVEHPLQLLPQAFEVCARAGLDRLVLSWCPPASVLGDRGPRSCGLPSSWSGSEISPEAADAYPLFVGWMLEAQRSAAARASAKGG